MHPWLQGVPTDERPRHISGFILSTLDSPAGPSHRVRSATVASYLHGIHHFFKAYDIIFPINHPQIQLLLRGLARFDPPPRSKNPVSLRLLERCFSSLDMSSRSGQALWGVLSVSFFFLLRRSEIAATTGSSFKWLALKARDITVVDCSGSPTSSTTSAAKVYITLHGSKTNQSGRTTTRMLSSSGHPFLCPVKGALLLLQAHGRLPPAEPAATFANAQGATSCVTSDQVSKAIKAAAAHLGEDPRDYSSHSLRAGGATHLYRAGVDSLTIQFHGRWSSDAFKTYTRLCEESVDSLSSRIIHGSRRSTILQPRASSSGTDHRGFPLTSSPTGKGEFGTLAQ